jgi:hypothetical protein
MLWAVVACLCWSSSARAEITYKVLKYPELNYLLVSGAFAPSDNPDQLALEVAASGANAVIFNSGGGAVDKAIEFGRTIRSLGLATVHLDTIDCVAACVFAFMGGVERHADDGSLAIHGGELLAATSSRNKRINLRLEQVETYVAEMGIDPALVAVMASTTGAPRGLTKSEMEKYRVITPITENKYVVQTAPETTSKNAEAPGSTVAPNIRARSGTPERWAYDTLLIYVDVLREGSDEALSFLIDTYADKIKTSDGMLSKSDLVKKKYLSFKQWPIRFYSSNVRNKAVVCTVTCLARAEFLWHLQNAETDQVLSGFTTIILTLDPKTGKIVEESFRHRYEREEKYNPSTLIETWDIDSQVCAITYADQKEILRFCEEKQQIERFFAKTGWCYGTPGKARNKLWHECGADGGNGEIKIPDSNDYPAAPYKGKSVLPDFKGRDRNILSAEAVVREAMRKGPNFGGHYTIVDLECPDVWCSAFAVDHKTGKPTFLPGAKNQKRLRVASAPTTRLVSMQSLYADGDRCIIDFFELGEDQKNKPGWTPIVSFDVGGSVACKRPIIENLTQ